MKKTVAYFVDDISTSFVIKDIKMLSKRFDRILLFSIDTIDDKSQLPENLELIDDFMDWSNYSKFHIIRKSIYAILSIYFSECYRSFKYLNFKTTLGLITSNIFKADEIERQLERRALKVEDIELFYSFWFYDCIYLAWLKKCFPKIKIISRTHGGDLFEDRDSINDRPLLRDFQLKYFDMVFPISSIGTRYLTQKYPKFKNKFETVFLGSEDYKKLNPFDSGKYVIVSCASIRHRKRIDAIAEALCETKREIIWYHFGKENLETNDPSIPNYLKWKETLKSHSNIQYFPKGYVENDDIMDFYSKTPVSLFISLSAAEGIPVSMMEAISFGIPVLSTDVGGCSEIVSDQTGQLIALETESKRVAEIIDDFFISDKNTAEFRSKIREIWKQKFEVNSNYEHFFHQLDNLQKN